MGRALSACGGVRSHRSRNGEGRSHRPGQARPPMQWHRPAVARKTGCPVGRDRWRQPPRVHRIGSMSQQAKRAGSRSRVAPTWRNGRRCRLRICCRKAWGFKSPRRHTGGWKLEAGSSFQLPASSFQFRARSRAGRRLPCTEEITGSNPVGSTAPCKHKGLHLDRRSEMRIIKSVAG